MTRSNDPVRVLVVALSSDGPANEARPAATTGLERADGRFTVEFESVSDADEALALRERTGVDCVVIAGTGDDPSFEVLNVIGEFSPTYTTTRGGGPQRIGFYVAGDGPGVPEREREDVFEIGYITDTDGTGFGLNIVQEVAAAHGWTVDVTEEARDGARFEITGVDVADEI